MTELPPPLRPQRRLPPTRASHQRDDATPKPAPRPPFTSPDGSGATILQTPRVWQNFPPWSLTSLTNSEQRDHHRQPRTRERDGAARIPVRSRAGVTIANCSALASADCSAHDGAVVPLIAGAVVLLEQSSHHDRRRPAAARCCSRTKPATPGPSRRALESCSSPKPGPTRERAGSGECLSMQRRPVARVVSDHQASSARATSITRQRERAVRSDADQSWGRRCGGEREPAVVRCASSVDCARF